MRLLRVEAARQPASARPQRRIYDDAVRQALVMAWEAADRICGKRLRALLPTLLQAMDRHGHLALDAAVRSRLLTMNAATIDRALVEQRIVGGRKRGRLGPSSAVRGPKRDAPALIGGRGSNSCHTQSNIMSEKWRSLGYASADGH